MLRPVKLLRLLTIVTVWLLLAAAIISLASCKSAPIGTSVICQYTSGKTDTIFTGPVSHVWLFHGDLRIRGCSGWARGFTIASFVVSYKVIK